MSENFLKKIKKISEYQKEEEICGFIVEDKGKEYLVECENVSLNKSNSFQISQKKYIETFEDNKIISIYHSHPNDSEEFSEADLKLSEALMIPMSVYSNKTKKFNIHIPKNAKRNKRLNNIEKSVVNY